MIACSRRTRHAALGRRSLSIRGILAAFVMSDASTPFLSVVIPAYNEEQRLPATLTDVVRYLGQQQVSSELLVVDDGSKDTTAEIVRSAIERWRPSASPDRHLVRFELLEYPDRKNRGKGYAVRTGMLAARGRHRVFLDADNSTTVDHVERFLRFVHEEKFDVVIGSRDVEGADVALHQPWYREVAGTLGNVLIRLLAVPGIADTQAGFKLFTATVVEDIFPRLTINRWGFDIEILAVARHRGYRIKEAPITWINDERSLVRVGTYLQVLSELVRVRWNLWTGVYGPHA